MFNSVDPVRIFITHYQNNKIKKSFSGVLFLYISHEKKREKNPDEQPFLKNKDNCCTKNVHWNDSKRFVIDLFCN